MEAQVKPNTQTQDGFETIGLRASLVTITIVKQEFNAFVEAAFPSGVLALLSEAPTAFATGFLSAFTYDKDDEDTPTVRRPRKSPAYIRSCAPSPPSLHKRHQRGFEPSTPPHPRRLTVQEQDSLFHVPPFTISSPPTPTPTPTPVPKNNTIPTSATTKNLSATPSLAASIISKFQDPGSTRSGAHEHDI
ncbi:hypothetical protein B0H13DRAFT_2322137 [Mycena leptocephala]|nr:hypothetical protein B0H13DRAFT_2322137 [Mycena leptocephala]